MVLVKAPEPRGVSQRGAVARRFGPRGFVQELPRDNGNVICEQSSSLTDSSMIIVTVI